MAGLQTIPAVIRDIPDEAAVAVALIENIQREDLNPIEEARSLHRLIEEFGLTHADAADAVGRSRATVTNLLRLLELPRMVRESLELRGLRHGACARAARLAVPEAANRDRREGTQSRGPASARPRAPFGSSAGARADKQGMEGRLERGGGDPNVRRLEAELAETLGAAVSIEHGPKGGRVVIRYGGGKKGPHQMTIRSNI